MRRAHPVSLDIVVPFFNEEDVLRVLLDRLEAVFPPAERARHGVTHVCYVMVDDGSTDRSAAVVAAAIEQGTPARLVRLSRNFGHQNAVDAGLAESRADVVAVIDADLQDPPELILEMLSRWRDGYEVVYARRRRRRESAMKRAGYWLFYRLIAFLSDVRIPLDSGDFCLLDRRVVSALRELPETLRFPRVLRAWVGFPQTGVDYDRPARRVGQTKYTLAKLYRLATDGVVSASIRPLQIAQVFSVTYLLVTVGLGLAFCLPVASDWGIPAWVLVMYLLILFGNFVQVFCMYILGAYVGRTYLEAKGRPAYLVMEVVAPREER